MNAEQTHSLAREFESRLRRFALAKAWTSQESGPDASDVACTWVRRILSELGCEFHEECFAEDWTALLIYDGEDRLVTLDMYLSPAERCLVMLHFVAHAALGHVGEDVEIRHEVFDRNLTPLETQVQEIEAERWIQDLIGRLPDEGQNLLVRGLEEALANLKSAFHHRASRRLIRRDFYRKLRGGPVGHVLTDMRQRTRTTPRTERPISRPVPSRDEPESS